MQSRPEFKRSKKRDSPWHVDVGGFFNADIVRWACGCGVAVRGTWIRTRYQQGVWDGVTREEEGVPCLERRGVAEPPEVHQEAGKGANFNPGGISGTNTPNPKKMPKTGE